MKYYLIFLLVMFIINCTTFNKKTIPPYRREVNSIVTHKKIQPKTKDDTNP